MASIVSQPAEENAFSVSSYEKLNDIVDEIGYDICQVNSFIRNKNKWEFREFYEFSKLHILRRSIFY